MDHGERGPGVTQFEYFNFEEFACGCGDCHSSGIEMDVGFVMTLDAIRQEYERPMIVTNGYRCERHPIERKKQRPGPHTTGMAADFAVFGEDALVLVSIALNYPSIQGIGLKQHGDVDQRFIHLDAAPVAPGRPRPWVWTYP